MKKLMVLAMMAVLLVAGSAFAGNRNLTAAANATAGSGVAGFSSSAPTTTNNDDSCDIGTAPAATLLLPWFEVDITSAATTARTTLFTVTNTSFLPQIAHVTIWTDWSFPVMDFNIFLTGYDVQAINLYDLLGGGGRPGVIAPPSGTSIATVPANNTIVPNAQPEQTNDNPNFLGNAAANCASLPGTIPPALLTDVRALLTTGRSTGTVISCVNPATGAQAQVGSASANAHGYITIDVAATCSTSLPTDPGYFTGEILFDNVLVGDYQEVSPSPTVGNYAGGNPMVHIRAVPEGGAAGSVPTGTTNLPYTFYDRYQAGAADRRVDRRQPLPSTFAARWIAGSSALFQTDYKIWREGLTTQTVTDCRFYSQRNSIMPIAQIVRFDEHENATGQSAGVIISPPLVTSPTLPEASRTPVSGGVFPPLSTSGDVGGWMYLNLSNGGAFGTVNPYSTARAGFSGVGTSTIAPGVRQSQNWVIVTMTSEGRYGVDFDAAWLGNGCGISPSSTVQVGPVGGILVCPPGAICNAPDTTTDPDTLLGTNTTP